MRCVVLFGLASHRHRSNFLDLSILMNLHSSVNFLCLLQPEDPFGTGMFAPPGLEDVKKQMSLHPSDKKSGPPPRPKSPSAPGRPKSPAPPKRPKSPVPPRPRSPAPPGRPKSPAPPSKQKKGPPPPRPPAPAKSPLPPGQDCPESQNGGEAMTFPMTSDVGHDFVADFNTNTVINRRGNCSDN